MIWFLAHLSTKCSWWAFGIVWCPTCVVRREGRQQLVCYHSSAHIHKAIIIKLGYDMYGHKVSNEFDFGWNPMIIFRVICPWITKFANSPCYHSSAFISCSIMMIFIQNVYDHKILANFDFGQNPTVIFRVICPWITKNSIFHLVTTLALSFLVQS